MKKLFTVLLLSGTTITGWSQLTSNKSGDIEFNDKIVAEVEKYDGSASTKPKFRVLTAAKDTLMKINFKKDLEFDWVQFHFKGLDRIVEVEYNEIVTGLNYRKNIGSWLVKKNLIKEDGTLNDTAYQSFLAGHTEDLTAKYLKLNEFNRKVLNTKFEFSPSDSKLVINGKHVGYATVPDGQKSEVTDIVFYDAANVQIGKGSKTFIGDVTMKMNNGKTVTIPRVDGDTGDLGNKMKMLAIILRELTRNGYYPI